MVVVNVVVWIFIEWFVFVYEIGYIFGVVYDCGQGLCFCGEDKQLQCCLLLSQFCDVQVNFIMNFLIGSGIMQFLFCSVGNICSFFGCSFQ